MCKLENKLIKFNGDMKQLECLSGHGVAIVDFTKTPPHYQEVGCIDFPTQTVIGKSGGQFINVGDSIVHNQEICRDGLRRYRA